MVYGKDPLTVFNLIQYTDKESVDKEILHTENPSSDGNWLGKGLGTVKENVYDVSARPGGHQVLVVLAAGKSLDDVKAPSRDLRDKGVAIFCIGIGDKVDVNQLRDIVSAPEEEHLTTVSSDQLERLLSPMVQNIRKGKIEKYRKIMFSFQTVGNDNSVGLAGFLFVNQIHSSLFPCTLTDLPLFHFITGITESVVNLGPIGEYLI